MDEGQQFCDRYGPLVWQCAYRVLANNADALDCTQDVLWELWKRGSSAGHSEPLVRWLATRRAIDALRRRERARQRTEPEGDVSAVCSTDPGPPDNASHGELMEALRAGVAELPSQQAEAFWMHCVEEVSQADIAQQLKISPNAVGVLVHRARKRLQQRLRVGLDFFARDEL